jgi:hypothetical protein
MGLLLAIISMAGRDFVSSSRNLDTKSDLRRCDMCPEHSARKGSEITSNYLLIGVKIEMKRRHNRGLQMDDGTLRIRLF